MGQTQAFIYKFTTIDYIVIAGYLCMLISVGAILRRFCKNVEDYFIGGNRVSWWMAGASCFMMCFSAWTFTGAASFAYKYGFKVILLFYASAVSFSFAALFIAHKCRQTRCLTAFEIIRQRYGAATEQIFCWLQIIAAVLGGAWAVISTDFLQSIILIERNLQNEKSLHNFYRYDITSCFSFRQGASVSVYDLC